MMWYVVCIDSLKGYYRDRYLTGRLIGEASAGVLGAMNICGSGLEGLTKDTDFISFCTVNHHTC